LGQTVFAFSHANTGYSLLYNFNNLANSQHVVDIYAAGGFLDSHTITTFHSGGTPWLSGVSKTVTVPDFPRAGPNRDFAMGAVVSELPDHGHRRQVDRATLAHYLVQARHRA